MRWQRIVFSVTVTEGLLTEATAELKQFVASDPSVLAADRSKCYLNVTCVAGYNEI